MTLTPTDKARLRNMGIHILIECKSTGECAVEQNGCQFEMPTEFLKRLARPSLVERVREWISGVAA